jgi:hypothetical protein
MTGMNTARTLSSVPASPRKGVVDLAVLTAFTGLVVWLLLF